MADHKDIIIDLSDSQEAESDVRENSREQEISLHMRGGQWEASVWNRLANRPRYSLDLMSPLIQQISGEMEKLDFAIDINPSSADSSKEVANTFNGIIRHIENISNANRVYNTAGRGILESGISGWRIDVDWANQTNFDQDLIINYISNFKDRVWFDHGSQEQDRSDADFCWVMTPFTEKAYKDKYPEGSGTSIPQDNYCTYYWYKPEFIVCAEYFWKEKKKTPIIQMSNGAVFEKNDDTMSVIDELRGFGIDVIAERDAEVDTVFVRKMDGDDWLDDKKETVFKYLPVIPDYGNFRIIEDKAIYYGLPEKLLDAQRITNYTISRLTEDTSLRAKSKMWMSKEQAAGNMAQYKTMNVDNKPIATFNHREGQADPAYKQPAPPDPTLLTIMEATTTYINKIAGLYSSNQGDNPGLQSGIAVDSQIAQGINGMNGYFTSQEIAICHTAKVLITGPIQKVYGDRQQVRILGVDGESDFEDLTKTVQDVQTGKEVQLIDMSKGQYDAVCSVGLSYSSRRQETIQNIIDYAKIDPTIIDDGSDIILANTEGPGMKDLAKRRRRKNVLAGIVTPEELTEEEEQMLQQQQQAGSEPSAQDQAAIGLVQAEQSKAEAQTADVMSKAQERQDKIQIEGGKLALKAQELEQKSADTMIQRNMDMLKLKAEQDKNDAQSLSLIHQAMGSDVNIVSRTVVKAYEQKARDLITDGDTPLNVEGDALLINAGGIEDGNPINRQ